MDVTEKVAMTSILAASTDNNFSTDSYVISGSVMPFNMLSMYLAMNTAAMEIKQANRGLTHSRSLMRLYKYSKWMNENRDLKRASYPRYTCFND